MAQVINASGNFVTEGEQRVAEELRRLPQDWVVIANKMLTIPNQTTREIDFIVVGDQLVFVLDDKGYSGRITGTPDAWTFSDGSSIRSPLNKVEYLAKVVAGYLNRRVTGLQDLQLEYAVGGIVLSRTLERPTLRDPRVSQHVMLLNEVVDKLLEWDARGPRPVYGGTSLEDVPPNAIRSVRSQIGSVLYDLSTRPKIPRQVNDYKILTHREGQQGVMIFDAEHTLSGRRRLTMYKSETHSVHQRFVEKEVAALQRLRETGHVPTMHDPFRWSEDYLVVPSEPPVGTSLAALRPPKTEDEAINELRLAAATFRALDRIHAAGVVHRALTPDCVFVDDTTNDGHPSPTVMFTDFFAARSGGETIAPILGELGLDDLYAAPEIVALGADGYGFADASSDVYSLALIWLERFSGVRMSDLRPGASRGSKPRTGRDLAVRIPNLDEGWSYLPERIVLGLRDMLAQALTAGELAQRGRDEARRLSAAECADRLEGLVSLAPDPSLATPEAKPGDLLDNRYTVIQLLGSGASARTYLARDGVDHDVYALKQLLRPHATDGATIAAAEFGVLKNLSHPNLPRVFDVYPPQNAVHLKMEFIEGSRLTDVMHRYNHSPDEWAKLASDICSAISYLEQHQLLHRDIKPDNIIVRDEPKRTVLVDFGIATAADSAPGLAGTPGYLPPEAYGALVPPASLDRYAAAVVLFEAYFGRKPFSTETGFVQQPISLTDLANLSAQDRALAQVLLRALATDSSERPPSAAEFLEQLMQALQTPPMVDPDKKRQINPTVNEILALFRNSSRGNADNRGLDTPFAHETYVPTLLDDRLLPEIFEKKPRVVFLSGNPGDGKTAFLERVRTELGQAGGTEVQHDPSGWEWHLDGQTYRACYDASEAHNGKNADQQLRDRLTGLEGDAPPATNVTVLVAINDGRLADFVENSAGTFGWLARATEAAQTPDAAHEPRGVWLVDLKQRTYVTLETDQQAPSLMRKVLSSFVKPERWAICDDCVAYPTCPIRKNAAALRTPVDLATPDTTPAARLEHLIRLAHLRSDHHLTIRDLRSGLAYLITAGQTCDDVHDELRGQSHPSLSYWHLAFTSDDATDVMLGQLRALDPARSAQPFLERYLFFHRDPADKNVRQLVFADHEDLALETAALPGALLNVIGQEIADASVTADQQDAVEWLKAIKRRLYFHGRLPGDDTTTPDGQPIPIVPWVTLLPYRDHAGRFLQALQDEQDGLDDDLLHDILRGIGRSDGLRGPILDEGLCLKVKDSDENRLTIIKLFPQDQFELSVERPSRVEFIESVPSALLLRHLKSGAALRITLDHFETLTRLAGGQEPGSPELKPLLDDLDPFKGRISLQESHDYYLIEDNRRRHLLTQQDGKIALKMNIGATAKATEAR